MAEEKDYGKPITFRLDSKNPDEAAALRVLEFMKSEHKVSHRNTIVAALLAYANIEQKADSAVMAKQLNLALGKVSELTTAANKMADALTEANKLIDRLKTGNFVNNAGRDEIDRSADKIQLPDEFIRQMQEHRKPTVRIRDVDDQEEE